MALAAPCPRTNWNRFLGLVSYIWYILGSLSPTSPGVETHNQSFGQALAAVIASSLPLCQILAGSRLAACLHACIRHRLSSPSSILGGIPTTRHLLALGPPLGRRLSPCSATVALLHCPRAGLILSVGQLMVRPSHYLVV